MDLTIGSHHFKLSLALLAGVAIAGVLLFRVSGPTVAFEQWLASGKQEVATHGVFVKQLERAKAAAAAAIHRAQRLEGDTARLRAQVDSTQQAALRLAGAIDTAHRNGVQDAILQLGAACRDQVANCEQRAIAFQNAAAENAARAELATARANRADSVVQGGLQAVECHLVHVGPIKLFGCPSRAQAFELGALLGAVGTLVLTHR